MRRYSLVWYLTMMKHYSTLVPRLMGSGLVVGELWEAFQMTGVAAAGAHAGERGHSLFTWGGNTFFFFLDSLRHRCYSVCVAAFHADTSRTWWLKVLPSVQLLCWGHGTPWVQPLTSDNTWQVKRFNDLNNNEIIGKSNRSLFLH